MGRLGNATQGGGEQETDLARAGAERPPVNRSGSGVLGQLGRRGGRQRAVRGHLPRARGPAAAPTQNLRPVSPSSPANRSGLFQPQISPRAFIHFYQVSL